MADFSWMRSEEFKGKIKTQVSESARRYGMQEYRTSIPGWLEGKLAENMILNESTESQKEASKQRGESEALQSVNRLMEYACIIAKNNKRTLVTEQDVSAAYSENYCQFWPLC